MVFEKLDNNSAYRILAPRPTIIVTTINSKNEVNAAPFSFTMPVSMDPPLVAFASVPSHDTYRNIDEIPEFVVNIPHETILEKLWITGEKFPYGVNEIEKAGLNQISSEIVAPPKIKECVGHLECKVEWIKEAGDHNLIVGRVVRTDIKPESLKDGLLNVEKVKPVLHLGGVDFVVGDHLRKVK
ncbi:MAG: flavin reductase family protein [Methanobacteriaceae archaeon]